MDKRWIYWFLFAILIRYLTSMHGHSGEKRPPMHGDYEAQRHWQEITYNLPMSEWYVDTPNNNLTYWGLDYPPLTAYHSWLNGWFAARYLNASWVELNTSHGLESLPHKLFMRWTVIIGDAVMFMVPLLLYFVSKPLDRPLTREAHFVCAVLYPGLILVDHGHFQYNCISLGLVLLALLAIERGHDCLASACFVLALNYKQMSLYYAMPFFCYLLGKCFNCHNTMLKRFGKLLALGVTVIATFAVIWAPIVLSSHADRRLQAVQSVLVRLFPFGRGLYEDKVANYWCTFTPIFRFNRWPRDIMTRLTLLVTAAALAPSSWDLLKRPSVVRLTYALLNSAMAFFLFSYQVHEKSILLVALPAMLLFRLNPASCMWLLIMTVGSMMPLLAVKDHLLIACIAVTGIYYVVAQWLASTEFLLIDALPTLFASSPHNHMSTYWLNNLGSGTVLLTPSTSAPGGGTTAEPPPSPSISSSSSMGGGVGSTASFLQQQQPMSTSSPTMRQLRSKIMKRQLMTLSFIGLVITLIALMLTQCLPAFAPS